MERTWTSIAGPLGFALVAVFGPGLVAVACLADRVELRLLPAVLAMSPTTEPTLSIARYIGLGGIDTRWLPSAVGLGFFALVAWIATRTWRWPEARWWVLLLLPTTSLNAWYASQVALEHT